MRKKQIQKGFSRLSVEDRIEATELTRTPEIKAYSAGIRRLIKRSTPFRVLSLITGGYIVWTYIRVFGIAGVGPVVNHGERQVAIQVSIAWIAIICFFVLPMMGYIYRGRLFRVNGKNGRAVSVFDQDAAS